MVTVLKKKNVPLPARSAILGASILRGKGNNMPINDECHGSVTKCPGCDSTGYDMIAWCRDCAQEIDNPNCPDCGCGAVQLYKCKECGHVYE